MLQETKLIDIFHTRESISFWMTEMATSSAHYGSVAVFYRKGEHFATEELILHGPNVIRFQLVTGRKRWHVVGCYIPPSNDSTIEDVVADIRDRFYGAKLLVAGDINVNLEDLEGTPQAEAIKKKLTSTGLMDIGLHLPPQRNPWLKDRCTWRMQFDIREV